MLEASHTRLPQTGATTISPRRYRRPIACLPTSVYGLKSAAVVAKQMLLSFPSIEVGLIDSVDISLGDIVISKPTDAFLEWYNDYGKTLAKGVFHRAGTLNSPPETLLTALSDLQE